MMNTEVSRLVILVAITMLSFSIAINAKSLIKRIVCSVISIALIVLVVTAITESKAANAGQEERVIEMDPSKYTVKDLAGIQEMKDIDDSDLSFDQINENKGEIFQKSAAHWIKSGIAWSVKINEFDLSTVSELSDEQYEQLVVLSKKYRYKVSSIHEKIVKLEPIDLKTDRQKSRLIKAGKRLKLAGVKLSQYFNAENAVEEKSIEAKFRKYSQLSLDEFTVIGKSFGVK
ncbi:MAG: hypothetical protein OCD76_09520 [Reichenbachiella sp.]